VPREPGSAGREPKAVRDVSEHTLSVELENKPGALARVSQLFARRGYNIQSLAVGPTEDEHVSRLTLRVDCSEHSLEQIEKQMHKLVNVLRVSELCAEDAVERELALVTVASPPSERADLLAAARASGAAVVDFAEDAITFQIVARPDDVDAFEVLLRPHGIRELARTGRIGLRRPHNRNENGNRNGNGKEFHG
jgi:acetolactate synthase I/III small subunit